jgi:hypothetical protein
VLARARQSRWGGAKAEARSLCVATLTSRGDTADECFQNGVHSKVSVFGPFEDFSLVTCWIDVGARDTPMIDHDDGLCTYIHMIRNERPDDKAR